jgi:hypothetical protein
MCELAPGWVSIRGLGGRAGQTVIEPIHDAIVTRQVMRQSMRLAAVGLGLGTAMALGASRFLASRPTYEEGVAFSRMYCRSWAGTALTSSLEVRVTGRSTSSSSLITIPSRNLV